MANKREPSARTPAATAANDEEIEGQSRSGAVHDGEGPGGRGDTAHGDASRSQSCQQGSRGRRPAPDLI